MTDDTGDEMDDGDTDDPFERLGNPERGGDPFQRLDDTAGREGDETGDEHSSRDGEEWEAPNDPFTDFDREPASGGPDHDGAPTGDTRTQGETGRQSPIDDLFADLDAPTDDPFSTEQSVFEEVDVGSVDASEVWASITEDGEDDDGPVVPEGSRYVEVSKHAFCEQCEHFSEPPNVHCSHESAEIIEFLDMETVRLLDCPVVTDREDIE